MKEECEYKAIQNSVTCSPVYCKFRAHGLISMKKLKSCLNVSCKKELGLNIFYLWPSAYPYICANKGSFVWGIKWIIYQILKIYNLLMNRINILIVTLPTHRLLVLFVWRFSDTWRRHHYRWKAAYFDLYSALLHSGILSVPHLLSRVTFVYNYHNLWRPVLFHLVPSVKQSRFHYLF